MFFQSQLFGVGRVIHKDTTKWLVICDAQSKINAVR